jgi:hypothetical protein
MIVLNKPDVPEAAFVSLLERTKTNCLEQISKEKIKNISPTPWENIVFNNATKSAKNSPFEGHIIKTGKHSFPDLTAKRYYGIEVKMTEGKKWSTTGNSALETTREEGVERIYIFFGKFGGKPEIKFKPYQDCLYDIVVTHSPRYLIDMDLPLEKTIFKTIGVDYDSLRTDENRIAKIKEYFRSQLKDGQDLWFIDKKELVSSPIISPYRKLTMQTKNNFVAESMILFPEIFGPSAIKYERSAGYLLKTYNAFCKNLRDPFSGGGQKDVIVGNRAHRVPKIFFHLYENANLIKLKIGTIESETLGFYWRLSKIPSKSVNSRISFWKERLNASAASILRGVTAYEVFEAGLD